MMELLGNSSQAQLTNQLISDRQTPILLSGIDGVGKRSYIRSLACDPIELDVLDGVDGVRGLKQALKYERDPKIVIIDKFHNYNEVAQDAFLKLFEDNTKDQFVLISSNISSVSDPIKSRIRSHVSWNGLTIDELLCVFTLEVSKFCAGSYSAGLFLNSHASILKFYNIISNAKTLKDFINPDVSNALSMKFENEERQFFINGIWKASFGSLYRDSIVRFCDDALKSNALNVPFLFYSHLLG